MLSRLHGLPTSKARGKSIHMPGTKPNQLTVKSNHSIRTRVKTIAPCRKLCLFEALRGYFRFVVDIKTGEQVEAKQKDKTLFTIASGVRFAFK